MGVSYGGHQHGQDWNTCPVRGRGKLLSLEKRWLQEGPNNIPQCPQGDYQGARGRLFTVTHGKKRDNKDKWK